MRGATTRWAVLLCLAIFVGATPVPAPDSGATALDALAGRYWQRELQYDYFLRQQLGKPVEVIRPITYANAEDDASFAQGILDGLKAIDASKLDHDRWLT